jgi:MFS family permease
MKTTDQPTPTTASSDVFLNLGTFQILTFLRRGIFYTFMINYLFILMQTTTWTAALGTLNAIGSSLGQNLLWGRICDKYKLRAKMIIIGETIAAFAYVAVFLVHNSLINMGNNFDAGLSIILGLSALEFFWSMSDVGWAALLTDVTTVQTRGKMVGILNFIASVGRMTGILIAGFLYAEGAGFRNGTIFFLMPFFLLTGAGIMALTQKRTKAARCTASQASPGSNTIQHFTGSERTYWWFLLSLIIIILGTACVNQVFLLFIRLPEGVNAGDTAESLILGLWTVGGMLASLASGPLADRIGRGKVMLMGLGMAVITPPLYGIATSIPMMAAVYGLNGVSFWTIQTVGFALAGDLIPEGRRGRRFGMYNAVMALSWGPAGLLIGGPLADYQHAVLGSSYFTAFTNVFYASSLIVTAGAIVFAVTVAKSRLDGAYKF